MIARRVALHVVLNQNHFFHGNQFGSEYFASVSTITARMRFMQTLEKQPQDERLVQRGLNALIIVEPQPISWLGSLDSLRTEPLRPRGFQLCLIGSSWPLGGQERLHVPFRRCTCAVCFEVFANTIWATSRCRLMLRQRIKIAIFMKVI